MKYSSEWGEGRCARDERLWRLAGPQPAPMQDTGWRTGFGPDRGWLKAVELTAVRSPFALSYL